VLRQPAAVPRSTADDHRRNVTERGCPMGRRTLLREVLDARARARKARDRERKRAEAVAARERREREREQAKINRERARERAAAERERTAASAKAERARKQATAAEARAEQAEASAAARAAKSQAAQQARADVAASRAARQVALDAKVAEAAQRTASIDADLGALERLLSERTRPSPSVPAAAETRFNRRGVQAMVDSIVDVLKGSVYPPGLTGAVAAGYRAELRELFVELELPRQTVAPTAAAYRYVRSRDTIEPVLRKDAEVRGIYARLLARIVIRTLAEALAASPTLIVTRVSINGYVSAKDRATGRAIRPCLISVGAAREEVEELNLDEPELDPQACLRHLNALISPHPYELEAVRPFVTFDLSRYKFVDEMNVVAGLDSRPDLTKLPPVEFEHLVRQLFEAMGLKGWVTRSSRDEGVDAVVVNEDPIVGGLCVIQAKRYSKIVGLEAVNALAGVMNDKAAAKGILVTTSWVGQASREFAARNGRMEIIEGRELRYLLKEHLGVDALIGLERVPPNWSRADLGTS
jgi:restriction system protein